MKERYEIICCGRVVTACDTKEKADEMLEKVRHSYLAMVHCKESFYIKKV